MIITEQRPTTGAIMSIRHCSVESCAGRLHYDGQNDGYLVVNSRMVWDLALLSTHADTLPLTGASFHDLAKCITTRWRIHGMWKHVTFAVVFFASSILALQ